MIMAGRLELTIDGKTYPCYQTAGAMLRFKDATGREVSEIRPGSISDLVRFLWCCAVSACAREKREFPLSLMEFADALDAEQLTEWQRANLSEVEAGDEKKSPSE